MRPVSLFLLKTEGQSSRQDSQSVQTLISMTGTLQVLPVFIFLSSTQSANRMQNLSSIMTPIGVLDSFLYTENFSKYGNRSAIFFDLITGIMATDSQHITVIRYSQRKSLTSRQGGPVILSDIFLL